MYKLLVIVLIGAIASMSAIADLSPGELEELSVSWSYFRRAVYRDAGSIRIGLRNRGIEDLVISHVEVNGRRIERSEIEPRKPEESEFDILISKYFPSEEKGDDVIWCWVTESNIQPEFCSELVVKFGVAPTGPVTVTIYTETGLSVDVLVEPQPALVSISSIVFSKDLSRCYVYIKSNSEKVHRVARAWIGGKGVTADVRIIGHVINPGSVACIVYDLKKPMDKGMRVYVEVELGDGLERHQLKRQPLSSSSFATYITSSTLSFSDTRPSHA